MAMMVLEVPWFKVDGGKPIWSMRVLVDCKRGRSRAVKAELERYYGLKVGRLQLDSDDDGVCEYSAFLGRDTPWGFRAMAEAVVRLEKA